MSVEHSLKDWVVAVRPWSFPASVMPVLVSAAYLFWLGYSVDWLSGLWAVVCIVLFHAGGNVWSDYFDFRRGVDAVDTFGSRTLVDGVFAAGEVLRLAVVLFCVGVLCGVCLMLCAGPGLLYIGLGGVLCGVLYPFLKYRGLGDVVILLCYGFLPMLGASYVVVGEFVWGVLWLSLPVGLITVGILHGNNVRDISTDRRAGIVTVAMKLGLFGSVCLYCAEVVLPFVLSVVFVSVGLLPLCVVAVLFAVFPAWVCVRRAVGCLKGGAVVVEDLDGRTALLQLVFGCCLCVSLVCAGLFS